ncbi:Chemotaxis response regulator protein-glutamate methylesterase [Palleronia abyssalis]|uniref:protein-glutamate methylesterase n=1 Tax=Palleronia abyssalis TaxID=1501240 RepID=A0A2R8BV84_9RHOB|nr:Chemotaxis response regulator protein-glutamate methylesterase [Palleronia abyssalis]
MTTVCSTGPDANVVDTVVVGGSAGGFNALRALLSELPADFPAAMVVCLHQPVQAHLRFAESLASHSRMPIETAEDGRAIDPGKVYIAGPDRHLMIGADHLHLRRGAHENNFRPAIDPLFRSAAVYRGPRAVGVILSGLMDDGAAGARALSRTGGQIVVQSPETTEFPDMPQATLDAVPSARDVALGDLAATLVDLVGASCADQGKVPWDIGMELKITSLEGSDMESERKLGTLSPFNCPHCNGVLWEIEDGPLTRFRCHTGHAYSIQALNDAQEEALDAGLFNALRAHRGRAELVRKIARSTRNKTSRKTLEARAERIREDTELLERIITRRSGAPRA